MRRSAPGAVCAGSTAPGLEHLEHRARARVGDAEAQEVERVRLGQHDEVGLREAGRERARSGRRARPRGSRRGLRRACASALCIVPPRARALGNRRRLRRGGRREPAAVADVRADHDTDAREHFGVSESAVGWLSQVFPLLYVILAHPGRARAATARSARRCCWARGSRRWAGRCGLGDTFTAALIGQILSPSRSRCCSTRSPGRVASLPGTPRRWRSARRGSSPGPLWRCRSRPRWRSRRCCGWTRSWRSRSPSRSPRPFGPRAPWSCRRCHGTGGRLATAFLGFGVFVALMTWLQALLEPAGVSEDEAGWLLCHDGRLRRGELGAAVAPARGPERAFLRTAAVVAAAAASAGVRSGGRVARRGPARRRAAVRPAGAARARPTTRSSGSPGTRAGSSWPCSCKRSTRRRRVAFSLLAAIAASVLAVA